MNGLALINLRQKEIKVVTQICMYITPITPLRSDIFKRRDGNEKLNSKICLFK